MQASEPRDPYGAALGAVKRFAEAGRFVPGEAIVVTELAAEVGLSATPVREALACLAGQGLIERRRGRGYFYPSLAAAEIIDLFELQLAYLHAALALYPRGLTPLRKATVGVDPLGGVQALFDAIITQSTNAALILAHQRVVDRLKAVLTAERSHDDADGRRAPHPHPHPHARGLNPALSEHLLLLMRPPESDRHPGGLHSRGASRARRLRRSLTPPTGVGLRRSGPQA